MAWRSLNSSMTSGSMFFCTMCQRQPFRAPFRACTHHEGRHEQHEHARAEHHHHHRVLKHRDHVERLARDEVVVPPACREHERVRERRGSRRGQRRAREVGPHFRERVGLEDVYAHLRGRSAREEGGRGKEWDVPAQRNDRAQAQRGRRSLLGRLVCLVHQERGRGLRRRERTDITKEPSRVTPPLHFPLSSTTFVWPRVFKPSIRLISSSIYEGGSEDLLGHCVFHCTRPLKSSASAETQVLL